MNLPDSSLAWVVVIVLSVVSSVFCWTGLRGKNVAHLLWGTGLAVPTFGVSEPRLWFVGATIVALGFWVHRKMTGI